MEVLELAPGLWRWTARHPGWTPAEDWEPEVGCVYWEAADAVVLVDPLVPPDEGDRFWRALDGDVGRLRRPVRVLLTCARHARSAAEVAARYGGELLLPDVGETAVTGARRLRLGEALPGGAVAVPATPACEEVVYWLPGVRAAVPGDTILGDGAGGVRLCPAAWLRDGQTRADLAAALRPLVVLGVERLLVSHGQPVLAEAASTLERALAEAA